MPTKTKSPAARKPAAVKPARGVLQLQTRDVLEAIKRLKPIAHGTGIQAYSGVMITSNGRGQVTLDSANGEQAVRVPVAGVGAKMEALVAVAELETAAKAIKHPTLDLKVSGRDLQVVGGRRTVTLPGLRKEDFAHPTFSMPGKLILNLDGDSARRVFRPALPFVSRDETRPLLTGVMIDVSGRMVYATDSYRLGMFPVKSVSRQNVTLVVPRLAITEAVRHPTDLFMLTWHEQANKAGQVTIQVDGGVRYVTRLIEGRAPDYRPLLPDKFDVTATVDGDDLRAAVEFTATACRRNAPLRIDVRKDELHLVGKGAPEDPTADEPVPATFGGKWKLAPNSEGVHVGQELGVNPDYFREAIKVMEPLRGGKLRLHLINPLRPFVLEGRDGKALLMPIRLNV